VGGPQRRSGRGAEEKKSLSGWPNHNEKLDKLVGTNGSVQLVLHKVLPNVSRWPGGTCEN